MRRTYELALSVLLTVLSIACDPTDGGAGSVDAETGTTGGGEVGSSEDGSSGGEPDLGPCADYLACAMAAVPETIASTIAQYGTEGTCWDLPGVTEENCWTECEALMSDVHELKPRTRECGECTSDLDCPAAQPLCRPYDFECESTSAIGHCDHPEFSSCTEGLLAEGFDCKDSMEADPGPCSSAQAVGICAIPYAFSGAVGERWVITYYADGGTPWSSSTASADCEYDGGVWMAAG